MIFVPVEHSRGELLLTDPSVVDAQALPPRRESRSMRKFRRKAAIHRRFAGFSTLTGSMSASFSWNASVALTGSAYNPTNNTSSIIKRQAFGTSASNTASGGCDECFSFQQGVSAASSATISLVAMTDLLQRASSTIARIKGIMIRVLSAEDDSTISPAPTATSVGVITNIGPAVPNPFIWQNGGSGLTLALTTTPGAVTAVAIGAAGTGYPPSSAFLVSPVQAGGSGCVVAVITNSSGVPTSVEFIAGAGGAGYTDATVPTVVVGQTKVYTGGQVSYFDPSAAGFALVSATSTALLLLNTDATKAITFEVDIFGAST